MAFAFTEQPVLKKKKNDISQTFLNRSSVANQGEIIVLASIIDNMRTTTLLLNCPVTEHSLQGVQQRCIRWSVLTQAEQFHELCRGSSVKLSLLTHCKIKETTCHLICLPHTELIYNNKIVPLCSGTPSEKSSALTGNTWIRTDLPSHPTKARSEPLPIPPKKQKINLNI